jgi:hypothetical protein
MAYNFGICATGRRSQVKMGTMRCDDAVIQHTPDHISTESMYIRNPDRKPLRTMPTHILLRGLCHKSGGDVEVCKRCPAPCSFGKVLTERGRA